jgi:hypothetical protein
MKKLSISVLALSGFLSLCTIVGAQTPGPIPIPNTPPDHYSWALPLADLMSYAKQAIRYVSGYTDAKTVLDSSAHRWIDFEFRSPRSDGVVLAKDINIALATNKFDLVIAESETGFSGNIDLADSRHQTLFNGGFWAYVSFDGGDNFAQVTYYLSPEISIPVPADLEYVKVSYRDAWGNERTEYFKPQGGWMRVRTNLGNSGTATAEFADGSEINFSLANGQAEREERVKVKVSGEFAHTYTFASGETMIVLGVEQWMLDEEGQFTAVFEPYKRSVVLYAETPQKLVAQSVRVRQLPSGVWSDPYTITSGVGLHLNLSGSAESLPGVWEAVFSFPIQKYDYVSGPVMVTPVTSSSNSGGGYSPTTGEPLPQEK